MIDVAYIRPWDLIQLATVANNIPATSRSPRILMAVVDHSAEMVGVVLDDLRHRVFHFRWFEESGDGTYPAFDEVSIVDLGYTLRLGNYEVHSQTIAEDV